MKLKNLLVLVCSFLLVMNLSAQQNQSELSDTETMFEKNDSPTVQQLQYGLYIGENFQGEMDLYEALDYITINAQEGGEYSIVLKENMAISSNLLDYGGKLITITLKSTSTDTSVQLSYATRSPSSSLFTVKKGVTFVLENGVELIGRASASRPPITVDGGTFIMNGGAIKDSIVDHSSDWCGGGVDVLSGGTFTMNNGVISGNSCFGGAGVNVGENSTFVMNGGRICENYAFYDTSGFGGGVYVEGSFTLVDGVIANNTSRRNSDYWGRGGGIYVSAIGTFVMEGGVIGNNFGGGIYIAGHGSLMGSSYGGNVTINGGRIEFNEGTYCGGVYVNYGSLTINNGIISQNIVSGRYYGGGGVCIEKGNFVMNGGEIIENTAKYDGGGVFVFQSGSFTMNGGEIIRNTAKYDGGGVYVGAYGKFTMNAGIISGNTTKYNGGGVLVHGGTFVKSNTAGVIYGGEATDGKANIADKYGHAVYTKNGSRDSTVRATMKLDSTKQGAEGGWE